jgi:hypothetical protein
VGREAALGRRKAAVSRLLTLLLLLLTFLPLISLLRASLLLLTLLLLLLLALLLLLLLAFLLLRALLLLAFLLLLTLLLLLLLAFPLLRAFLLLLLLALLLLAFLLLLTLLLLLLLTLLLLLLLTLLLLLLLLLALLLHLPLTLLFNLSLAGLDALDASCTADIAELPLQIRVLERHIGAMRRVEPPVLELPPTGDVDSVEPAVKGSVGLDRGVTPVSPIVVVPQRRPDKGCRAEPDYGADRPPWWMPEEWHVCRRPIIGTVYDHRIVDRDVNIIRFNWFDDDVFGWPCIAGAWGRRDPPDFLLLTRLEIAGLICPGAQGLNRVLDVVGLSQKGLAELLGPVQLIVHHRQYLRD